MSAIIAGGNSVTGKKRKRTQARNGGTNTCQDGGFEIILREITRKSDKGRVVTRRKRKQFRTVSGLYLTEGSTPAVPMICKFSDEWLRKGERVQQNVRHPQAAKFKSLPKVRGVRSSREREGNKPEKKCV